MTNVEDHFAYIAAHLIALHAGLAYHDSENCALEFVEAESQKAGGLENLTALCIAAPALVRKCALNFVRNHVRAKYRLSKHLSEWPQTVDAAGESRAWDADAKQPEPDRELIREAFWDLLLPFLQALSRKPRSYFLRHHVAGETVEDIARMEGVTARPIAESIYRSRKKLRVLLEASGYSYEVLREFVAPPPEQ